jgi:phosphonopyruvate decarboxylase
MICPDFFHRTLKDNGVDFFTGVPDSLLKEFGNFVSSMLPTTQHTIAANEGAAVGLAIGHHLATGKIPLVYLQNSGLGNTINPLVSLADPTVYGIPLLLLIGWRGEPDIPDEPQHKKQGPITLPTLDAMDIKWATLHKDLSSKEVISTVDTALQHCRQQQAPFALVVHKNTFEKFTKPKHTSDLILQREQAIATIMKFIQPDDIVVATTGMISRELYEQREMQNQSHQQDFLVVGGMGHCSSIALRIAMEKPNRTIYCLDGDGSILMHMGSLAVAGTSACKNFKHIVLNNGVHDSVGGQPTVGLTIDMPNIAKNCHYRHTHSVETSEQLENTLPDFINQSGPCFLQVCVKPGNRADLGRPTQTPQECKVHFMQHLSS